MHEKEFLDMDNKGIMSHKDWVKKSVQNSEVIKLS